MSLRSAIIPYTDPTRAAALAALLLDRNRQFSVMPHPADLKNEKRTGWMFTWPDPVTQPTPVAA